MSTRAERNEGLKKLEQVFSEAVGIYLTDFSGIDVQKITKFRKDLRGQGARYLVVKNTLATKALEKSGKKELVEYISGPVGIAFSNTDAILPARVIKNFRKENNDLLQIKIAYIGGKLFSAEDAAKIANLPSREVLLSQLLSCMQAPISGLAGVLNGILVKFIGTLESLKNKKES